MIPALVAYAIALIVFLCIDITWLMLVGAQLYKAALSEILAADIRLGPAAVFYLLYPVGIAYFAVMPALKDGSVTTALLNGALYGLMAYGTYELTNYATLRGWTFTITAVDMVYGAVASATVAVIAFYATPAVSRWFGA